MPTTLRSWQCRNCGRSNRTEVELDGTVRCEHCTDPMKIQPSRARGGETVRQLSHVTARTRWSPAAE